MVTISKIAPLFHGDWHDKPLRYEVRGPGVDLQRFSTKKDALRYASIRRKSADQNEACNRFLHP